MTKQPTHTGNTSQSPNDYDYRLLESRIKEHLDLVIPGEVLEDLEPKFIPTLENLFSSYSFEDLTFEEDY